MGVRDENRQQLHALRQEWGAWEPQQTNQNAQHQQHLLQQLHTQGDQLRREIAAVGGAAPLAITPTPVPVTGAGDGGVTPDTLDRRLAETRREIQGEISHKAQQTQQALEAQAKNVSEHLRRAEDTRSRSHQELRDHLTGEIQSLEGRVRTIETRPAVTQEVVSADSGQVQRLSQGLERINVSLRNANQRMESIRTEQTQALDDSNRRWREGLNSSIDRVAADFAQQIRTMSDRQVRDLASVQ